jgi:hypothetical protein
MKLGLSNLLQVFVSLALAIDTFTAGEGYSEEGWKSAADFLLEGYDHTVKPCDDFVKYSCGKWLKSKKAKEEVYTFGATAQHFAKEVQESIFAVDVNDEATPKYKKICSSHVRHVLKYDRPR